MPPSLPPRLNEDEIRRHLLGGQVVMLPLVGTLKGRPVPLEVRYSLQVELDLKSLRPRHVAVITTEATGRREDVEETLLAVLLQSIRDAGASQVVDPAHLDVDA